jgi:predicted metal-dependent phosphoesterase TrpH
MPKVDLHTHSTASDGSFSPTEVVRLAREAGLAAFALTDHDTIDGVAEAMAAGEKLGVQVIPGVEISARYPGGTLHILGLGINYQDGHLDQRLEVLKQARSDRNPQIIAKLNALGLKVSMEQVERLSGGGQVGRPHIAQALLESGYVRDLDDAFNRFLGNRGPAYVSKFRFPPAEAIAMIREARGAPVLAHPFTLDLRAPLALKLFLQELHGLGLAGVEAYYPEHSPEQEALYLELARDLGLLVTGGSDFHGAAKPDITLGTFPAQPRVTYALVEALENWRRREFAPGH